MNGFLPIVLAGLMFLSVLAPADTSRAGGVNPDETQLIELDGNGPGRVFDGIGGLSAGAASRLLMDYPKQQRSQILDFLFKPNFGASLHDLKVEIGGTVNSTWGAEPSHANTRDELEHPQREYYDRGYEWWLMEEARKRNPTVILESLQWGAPGWIGGGEYFSQDNADYVAAFIKGAHDHHGLSINYQGIRNEVEPKIAWIKTLRNTLDRNGLQAVKLAAADLGGVEWKIVKDMLADPELSKAVYAANIHYPPYTSTEAAKAIGKPLWDSEDGQFGHPWGRAKNWARMYNRNYIIGRMTKTIVCTAITSLYEFLPAWNVDMWNDPGLMKANTPWSGHYEVPPAIWVTAHSTQFAQPGWRYMDGSCGFLKKAGSYVALRSPDKSGNYSIIIETMNNLSYDQANVNVNASDEDTDVSPCLARFNLKSLSTGPVHVWRSNKSAQFERLPDITPENGSFQITLDGNCVYSLTTTKGQRKGSYNNIPKDFPFPFPYEEDFESYDPGKMARYFSDQEGTFVVAERADGHGKCLRQIVPKRGIEWCGNAASPWTIVGGKAWKDYEVSVDAHVPDKAFAAVYGRIDAAPGRGMPGGYGLTLDSTGAWQLKDTTTVLQSGKVGLTPGAWHNLKLGFSGDQIIAAINGNTVCSVMDDFHPMGAVAVASSYHEVEFDNFTVKPFEGAKPEPVAGWGNLALGKKTTASSQLGDDNSAAKATDGDHATGWSPQAGKTSGEWLEVDFGKDVTFDKTILDQHTISIGGYAGGITGYKIQYFDGAEWKDAVVGKTAAIRQTDEFPAVTASKVRLLITACADKTCIYEFKVYRCER